MSLNKRVTLYREIELYRKRPLIVYVTSKREGVWATMASDALPYVVEQLDLLDEGTQELDFLIASNGGDPMVAWRIMSLIRERGIDKVSVLVPQSAYSAATMVALGANEIVMHPNSNLGPVDMQITSISEVGRRSFSTEEITAFLSFVRERLGITDQEHIRSLFELTCKEVGSLGVGFTVRSARLAIDLGERLLGMHLKDVDAARRRVMVEELSRVFQSHDYPVSRTEAIGISLPVNKERDKKLERLMWSIWLDLEAELKEREPFKPIIELLRSNEAKKLLAPVPQLDLPMNAPTPMVNADLTAVQGVAKVDPVPFELLEALIESPRLAWSRKVKGMILSCRTPDLAIQLNALQTFSGWDATPISHAGGS